MSCDSWSGVRQLILLRTKRKAAEAALSSFMLSGGDQERQHNYQEPAPLSTLVLNCFIDVIGQQVQRTCLNVQLLLSKFLRMQEFYPSMMSIALAEFHGMLLSMQVRLLCCHVRVMHV
jgi:hypothetical protein